VIDPDAIVAALERNREVFSHLLAGRRPGMNCWRPAAGTWSRLEIVCHLYDEERDDFRARVRYALESPPTPLAPIDPQGWVTSRDYAGQDYETTLHAFLSERSESIAWLRSLRSPRWEAGFQHPQLGAATARMFLTNWLAHDLLHLRQILRLEYQWLRESGEDLSYAGTW